MITEVKTDCPDCWGVGELMPLVTCPRCKGTGFKPQRLVIITVSGGVADVESCPPDVEVEIKDYDNCENGSDEDYCHDQD